jgi:hypothetical protein
MPTNHDARCRRYVYQKSRIPKYMRCRWRVYGHRQRRRRKGRRLFTNAGQAAKKEPAGADRGDGGPG